MSVKMSGEQSLEENALGELSFFGFWLPRGIAAISEDTMLGR
jgi:hypothetical protein